MRIARISRNLVRGLLHRSDYSRWSDPASLETWWDSRTQQLARFVPSGTRVVEFGAGRRQLERHLPPGCSYIPADLADRGPGTLIFDLNQRPLPDLRQLRPDVAFFAGVLEYVRDLPSLVRWLSQQAPRCVASYAYATSTARTPQRALETLQRAYHGYMNTYSEGQLKALFGSHGYTCLRKETWDSQLLFLFHRGQHGEQLSPLRSSQESHTQHHDFRNQATR